METESMILSSERVLDEWRQNPWFSHLKEFWMNGDRIHDSLIWKSFGWMETESMLTPVQGKSPPRATRSSEEARTCDAASHSTVSPTHYQLSYSCPVSITASSDSKFGLQVLFQCGSTYHFLDTCCFAFYMYVFLFVCFPNPSLLFSWMFERDCPDRLLVDCLTSHQQASVSQGRICTDNFTCCHTETEVADPTFYLTQSQYTDTGPTSPSADPITPGAWQGSHWSANF